MYSFLNTSKKGFIMWYVGMMAAVVVVFFWVSGIHKLRDRVARRKDGKSGRVE